MLNLPPCMGTSHTWMIAWSMLALSLALVLPLQSAIVAVLHLYWLCIKLESALGEFWMQLREAFRQALLLWVGLICLGCAYALCLPFGCCCLFSSVFHSHFSLVLWSPYLAVIPGTGRKGAAPLCSTVLRWVAALCLFLQLAVQKIGLGLCHCLQSALCFPTDFPVAHHVCWDGNKYEQIPTYLCSQRFLRAHKEMPCYVMQVGTLNFGSERFLQRSRASKSTERFCSGYKEEGSYKALI